MVLLIGKSIGRIFKKMTKLKVSFIVAHILYCMKISLLLLLLLCFPWDVFCQQGIFQCINSQSPIRRLQIVKLLDGGKERDTVLFGKVGVHKNHAMFTHFRDSSDFILGANLWFEPDSAIVQEGVGWGMVRVKFSEDKKAKVLAFEQNKYTISVLDEALSASDKWFAKNRKGFDLNLFKITDRYQNFLAKKIKLQDLNKAKYIRKPNILFWDATKGTIGVEMGKCILQKNIQWGHFLNYTVVYDYKNKKVVKVYVYNTGYFLE